MNDCPKALSPKRRGTASACVRIRSNSRPIVVVSDLHLGPSEPQGFPRALERGLAKVLTDAHRRGQIIVLAGDIFDVVAEQVSEKQILAAYPRLEKTLTNACAETNVYFLRGNHDAQDGDTPLLPWVVSDALYIDDSILIAHGHQFDPVEQAGWAPACERFFASIQKLTRGACRHAASLDGPLPLRALQSAVGGTIDLLLRCGERLGDPEPMRGLRVLADSIASQSQDGDRMLLLRGLTEALPELEETITTIVCGHSHAPGIVPVLGRTYVNAGAWTDEHAPVVRIHDGNVIVEDMLTGCLYDDELYRGWEQTISWNQLWRESNHGLHPRDIAKALAQVAAWRVMHLAARVCVGSGHHRSSQNLAAPYDVNTASLESEIRSVGLSDDQSTLLAYRTGND